MTETTDLITVHVNVEMTAASPRAIVENAKRMAGRDEKGYFRVDAADKVGELISRFLLEKNFESHVKDLTNYGPSSSGEG
ncbi:MAG: hypothetical protein GY859_30805 [Desulfobacterales bacterium]|nr:hypothetical protein [Desulfobacterales bacterium]